MKRDELRNKVERLVGTAIPKNDKNYTDDFMELIDTYEKPMTWFVTSHEDPNNIQRVAGPFTTDGDAAQARAILEAKEDHHNYWLEQ